MVEKRLFAVFTATCALVLAVVLDLFLLHVLIVIRSGLSGATGAIAPAPPLQAGPRDEIYLFQIKYSYEKLWLALQEYNSLLYSYVALSIWAPNQWRN